MWKSKLLISWIVFRPTVSKTRCFGSAFKTFGMLSEQSTAAWPVAQATWRKNIQQLWCLELIPLIIILLRHYRGHACFKVDRPNIAQKVVMIAFMELRWKNQNQDSSALGLATFLQAQKDSLSTITYSILLRTRRDGMLNLRTRCWGVPHCSCNHHKLQKGGKPKEKKIKTFFHFCRCSMNQPSAYNFSLLAHWVMP